MAASKHNVHYEEQATIFNLTSQLHLQVTISVASSLDSFRKCGMLGMDNCSLSCLLHKISPRLCCLGSSDDKSVFM